MWVTPIVMVAIGTVLIWMAWRFWPQYPPNYGVEPESKPMHVFEDQLRQAAEDYRLDGFGIATTGCLGFVLFIMGFLLLALWVFDHLS